MKPLRKSFFDNFELNYENGGIIREWSGDDRPKYKNVISWLDNLESGVGKGVITVGSVGARGE